MISAKGLTPEALSALVDASAAINAPQSLNETLGAIARAAVAVLRAEAASVIMLDEPRGKQVFRAAVGDRADQLIGVEYDQGLGVSGKVLQTGQAAIVNDVKEEKAHYKEIDTRTAFMTRSLIAAPLVHRDRKLGVVEVLNPLTGGQFTEPDRQLAQVFANMAAIAAANSQARDRLQRENRGLREAVLGREQMIGAGPAMVEVENLIRRVARSAATVLLLGETGTGKELAARMIHNCSARADRAFIAVNCAALPETLLESELFGHEAGAFTGATGKKLGRFELADGGTIFLDEIAEVAPSVQVKLLRVLEEKEIVRLGGVTTIGCDVRVIAATNRDLNEEIREKRFREDLYYRLNVFPIRIPPLRDRQEDLPLLAEYFLKKLTRDMKIPMPSISPEAMAALSRHRFPGNVRELQNILERACLLCGGMDEADPKAGLISLAHLPSEIVGVAGAAVPGESALASQERALILNALRQNDWNQTKAAEALGVSRDNIRYRVKKHGIKRPRSGGGRPDEQ